MVTRPVRNRALTTLTVVTIVPLVGGILIAIITAVVVRNSFSSFQSPDQPTLAAIEAWQTVAGWCVAVGSFGLIAMLAVRAILGGFGKLEEPLPQQHSQRPAKPPSWTGGDGL